MKGIKRMRAGVVCVAAMLAATAARGATHYVSPSGQPMDGKGSGMAEYDMGAYER